MIRHAIWDFDGTLFDTYPVMSRAFHEALLQMGCPDPPTQAEVREKMRFTMQDAFDAFVSGRGLSVAAFTEIYRPLRIRLEEEAAKPFPGAKELCRDLIKAGGRNFIFTHRSRTALPMLDQHGMTGDFAGIVTMDDGFPRKPAPDAIQYLQGRFDFAREDAIMIGDRELDILSGLAAGVHTCRVFPEPGEATQAEFTAHTFAELRKILGLAPGI